MLYKILIVICISKHIHIVNTTKFELLNFHRIIQFIEERMKNVLHFSQNKLSI